MTLVATPVVVDVTVSAPTILVDILTVSGPRGLPGEAGTALVVSVDAPPDPTDGMMWLKSDTWVQYTWYVDDDSAQWVQTNGGGGGGGGGGGIEEAPIDGEQYARSDGDWEVVVGDDLDTTPVAATGSTLDRVVPDWLAGAPVIEIAGDVLLAPEHRGAWLHMMNAIGSLVILPDYWLPGMAVGVRQVGIGQTQWQFGGNSTTQMPVSRSGHIGISEQYEEIICRVISNSDGSHAVWGISGSTY